MTIEAKRQMKNKKKMLVCDTKAKTGILFRKDAFYQLSSLQDNTNRIMYVKQLMTSLAVEKVVQKPPDMTSLIILQLKYTGTAFQTQFNVQCKTVILSIQLNNIVPSSQE